MEADTYIKDEAFDLFHEAVLFRFTETGRKSLPFTADMPRQSCLTLLKMHKAFAI